MTAAHVRSLTLFFLALSALLLSGALWLAAWPWGALPVVGLAGLWALWVLGRLARNGRAFPWLPSLLGALLALSGAGALLRTPAVLVWVYLGVVAALAAWDLSGFYGRLAHAGPHVIAPERFSATHLRRLALPLALALLGLLLLPLIPRDFSFDRTLLLALLLVLGLGFLVRRVHEGLPAERKNK